MLTDSGLISLLTKPTQVAYPWDLDAPEQTPFQPP